MASELTMPHEQYKLQQIAEIADHIRFTNEADKKLLLRGGGTHSFGIPHDREMFSIAGLRQIVDYAPEDMTITVEAGLPFCELQSTLKKNNQWLPLEPPINKQSTIGGIAAANASGASRYLFGTMRNWLLGARFITANGDIVHTGSKVVKSVAGYDMHKLLIGSYGTLAVIAELTFKVAPLPEKRGIVIICSDDIIGSMTASPQTMPAILNDLQPAFIVFCNKKSISEFQFEKRSVAERDQDIIVFGFNGFTEETELQIRLTKEKFAFDRIDVYSEQDDVRNITETLINFTFAKPNAVRMIAPPADTLALIAHIKNKLPNLSFIADIGSGVIDVIVENESYSFNPILANIDIQKELRAAYLWNRDAAPVVGIVSLQEKNLARGMKKMFDPKNLFGDYAWYK